MQRSLFVGFGFALVVLIAACGDDSRVPGGSTADSPAPQSVVDLTVADTIPVVGSGDLADPYQVTATLSEWKIEVSPPGVPAGEVTVGLSNQGERAHTIEIRSEAQGRWRSLPIPPGGIVGLTMQLAPGTYEVTSTDPEYARRGMRAELVVR